MCRGSRVVTSAGSSVNGKGALALAGTPSAGLCAVAINELNEEAIELIFTFLPPEDCRSAAAVCRLWRRVHNSSTKLWGTVLLSGERVVQVGANAMYLSVRKDTVVSTSASWLPPAQA